MTQASSENPPALRFEKLTMNAETQTSPSRSVSPARENLPVYSPTTPYYPPWARVSPRQSATTPTYTPHSSEDWECTPVAGPSSGPDRWVCTPRLRLPPPHPRACAPRRIARHIAEPSLFTPRLIRAPSRMTRPTPPPPGVTPPVRHPTTPYDLRQFLIRGDFDPWWSGQM
jgi:hypothetical protein